MTIELLFPFNSGYVHAQDFGILTPVLPTGASRINTQPADIITDGRTLDITFAGVEAYSNGNLLKYSAQNLVTFHQKSSYYYNELERVSIHLPAISISLSEKASLGGTIFYRHQTNIKSLAPGLGSDIVTEFSNSDRYNELRSQQSGSAAMLSYYGSNITYARVLAKQRKGKVNGGISILGLLGASSAYTRIHHINYSVVHSNVMDIQDYHLELGGSTRLNDTYNQRWLWLPDRSVGVGTNVGISWNRESNYTEKEGWKVNKVGLALLNVGFIQFNRGIDNFTAIGRDQSIILDIDRTFGDAISPSSIYDSLNHRLDLQRQYGHYRVGLPTTVLAETSFARMSWRLYTSLQIDVSTIIGYQYFLSSMSRLNVVPAWQGRYFSVGLPITLSLGGGIQLGTFFQASAVSMGLTLTTLQPEGGRQAGFFLLFHLPTKRFYSPQTICKPFLAR